MRLHTRAVLTFLAVAALALIAGHLLDRVVYEHLHDPRIYERDWGRMLRVMGFLPLWVLAALALALHDGAGAAVRAWRAAARRAGFLLLSPVLTGLAGEAFKLLIRRERPSVHGGAYVFRPWSDRPLSTGGLAMPSSHAVVAFGAAFALSRLFPRATPVWVVLAVGCAYTRVAARAHFVSDVVLAALLGWAVVALLWRVWLRRSAIRPAPAARPGSTPLRGAAAPQASSPQT